MPKLLLNLLAEIDTREDIDKHEDHSHHEIIKLYHVDRGLLVVQLDISRCIVVEVPHRNRYLIESVN